MLVLPIGTVTVKPESAAGSAAIITVTAYGDASNDNEIGKTTFTVKVGDYLVTVNGTENAKVTTTGTEFTAKSTAAGGTDATSNEGATWSWTVSGDKATSFGLTNNPTNAATVAATDNAADGDTATVTATYTDKDGKTASYSFDVTADVTEA